MKHKIYSLLTLLLVFTVGASFWLLSVITLLNVGNQLLYKLIIYPTVYINVSGTGSMYPTFPRGNGSTPEEREQEVVASPVMVKYPNGITINSKQYYKSDLKRGDIVSFYSGDRAYIKRIIGTPGDILEIRNGLVYLNGEGLKEPYTALPHSTFGGDFVAECKKIEIPEGNYFVLGDNRKESNDSRFEVGFVKEENIDTFLPLNFQKSVLDKNWRETSSDLEESTKIRLIVDDFVAKINAFRATSDKPALKYMPQLQLSAGIRARNIFETGIFDEENKGSLSIADSIKQADYWQPVYGEIPIQGYFSAEEMYNYLTEFDSTKSFVLDNDFTQIGISVIEGALNDCPTQLIVIHLAGYVPPNYDVSTISSWEDLLTKLKEIKPGWEESKEYDQFYEVNKRDIDKVISIISDRINYLEPIVNKMKADEWLTSSETDYLERDRSLGDEQEKLADRLNNL